MQHSLRKMVVALAVTGAFTAIGAGPTSAGAIPFTNGYSADAGGAVVCDNATAKMTLFLSASNMAKIPYGQTGTGGGYTPGVWDQGQLLTYNVWVSVDGGNWTPQYSWAPWQWANGMTSVPGHWDGNPEPTTAFVPTRLLPDGGIAIQGLRGRNYQVLFQVAWYTGNGPAAVVNVFPSYTMKVGYNTLEPSSCSFWS